MLSYYSITKSLLIITPKDPYKQKGEIMGIFPSDTGEGEEEFREIFEAMQRRLWVLFIRGYRITFKRASGKIDIKNWCEEMVGALAVRPMEDPGGFGRGLGIFFGILRYHLNDILSYPHWGSSAGKDFKATIIFLKSRVEGFDFNIVKKRVRKINAKELDLEQIRNLRELLSLL